MTDNDTIDEVEKLNSRHSRDWRRIKRNINKRARSLVPNSSYALGCRGHPGIVIERNWDPTWSYQNLYSAGVTIKSLIDGQEESCSVFHCSPMILTKQEAEDRAEEIRTMHDADISVKHGLSVEDAKSWIEDWIKRGVLYYVLTDMFGQTTRSTQAFTEEEAKAHVAYHQRLIAAGRYHGNVTNPRIVEMLTYPAPIKSFEVTPLIS